MVDPKLRVYGTENVRVVDLSIVPLAVGAHIQGASGSFGSRILFLITPL